jgi:F420H(2)-dependent biliverdin reductase
MAFDPAALPDDVRTFVSERHLATLTTVRADGSPHVAPVGFTWDDDARLVRVITFAGAAKVRHLTHSAKTRAAVCQVDGGRWLTFEGEAVVTDDPARVAEAVQRYAARYRPPSERPDRVAIEITVDRILGRP